jgi:AAA15 family ATPase/GTPase
MLSSLKIENFRCFSTFELPQLGRLNLLVGTNNCGKTSILEAIQILASQYTLSPLKDLMISRGEYIVHEKLPDDILLDISHLFYGREIHIDSKFSMIAEKTEENLLSQEQLSLLISVKELPKDRENYNISNLSPNWHFVIESAENAALKQDDWLSISPPIYIEDWLLQSNLFKQAVYYKENSIPSPTQFIAASSLTIEKTIDLFDRVMLTPEEDFIVEALQIIEPSIDRIASFGSNKYSHSGSRNGFVIRLKDSKKRIPIGSMGDGMWRMLGLILAIVNAKDGILLVDEIDTGLHYSVMSDMWKILWKMANKLNVQIFATTHNSDCWTSLATIANEDSSSEGKIIIHRIEKEKERSTTFSAKEISIAAERGIEVR